MSYRDAYITEVMVTLKGGYANRMPEALKQLEAAGLQVDHANDDINMVEGRIEASKAQALDGLDAVQYVRKMHTYAVDYPAGDPRDLNNGVGVSPDILPPTLPRRYGKKYP